MANILKGTVVSHANKAYVTSLNNPGFYNNVKPMNSSDQHHPFWSWLACWMHGKSKKPTSNCYDVDNSITQVSVDSASRGNMDNGDLLPLSKVHTKSHHHVYAKFALRDTQAIGMFYFSQAQVWGIAAHVIYEALHGLVPWQPHMQREPILCLPFQFYDKRDQSMAVNGQPITTNALLVLAIDETRHEDIFWSAGMEFISILMGVFTDTTHLCSESEFASDLDLVGVYVHHVIKMILLSSHTGNAEGRVSYPGVVSMMRAIDLVRAKYPFDTSEFALPIMRSHALAAVKSVVKDRS